MTPKIKITPGTLLRTRADATEFLNNLGVPTGRKQLGELAALGRGPRYVIINGRALYTEPDLVAWVQAEANKPPSVAKRGRARNAVA